MFLSMPTLARERDVYPPACLALTCRLVLLRCMHSYGAYSSIPMRILRAAESCSLPPLYYILLVHEVRIYCSTYVCKSCVLVLALAANFCMSEREFCAPSASVLGRDRATYVHKAARETPLCRRGPSQPLSLTSTQDTPHVPMKRQSYVRTYGVRRERHRSVAVYLMASLSRVHSRHAT